MVNGTVVVDRLAARKLLVVSGVILGLAAPSAASAAIPSVFGSVTCTEQTSGATTGQRFCGNSAGSTVTSFDGTPIDVAVGFPVASGSDDNYPVVGIYHGWGGTKIVPSSATAQRWLTKGYAVFSISDRGWGSSCGGPAKPANTVKAAPCEHGYIHLMARAYEVRDVQTLLGKLADEGVISPQAIGATGGSYGGGMSLQLGSLKDRVELPNHELIAWESPGGKPMKIAATAPEFPWTDISQALVPNGSGLDYVANSPYTGMLGDHRFGIEKNNWNGQLYNAGLLLGYYGPESDPEANLTGWHNFNITGGPYDGKPLAVQQEEQLPYHSPYYTNLSEPPAPSLMENGWNDDLFPVDETVRYYNKVRATYPNQAMKLFYLDLGHNPRSASTVSVGDVGKFQSAQNAWFAYYLKGEGGEPAELHGGVSAITSFCPQTAGGSGTEYKAANWASLAPGEIRLNGAAEQTILAPGTAPATAFTSGTICTTQAAGDNASTATYKLGAAPASGFTIMGASTVIAEYSTPAANDQVIARLYDVNVPGGGTQQLIGRETYRPLNPGEGFTKQIFQLHPQAWNVAAGHVVKLELLVQDSTYARNSSSPHSVQVRNLELRLPTTDAPGAAEGLVQAPLPKYLPAGYTLARNVPTTVPGVPFISSGTNPNTGVFTLAWEPSAPAVGLTYTLQHKPAASGSWSTVATGLTSPEYAFTAGSKEEEGTWIYRVSASNEGPASEYSGASAGIKVDRSAPTVTTEPASAVTQGSATLNAAVNPKDQTVSDCHFEYGTTEAYGSSVSCSSLPGSGESPVMVSAPVTGLTANTIYHFRIVAANTNGTSYGSDGTFKTLTVCSTTVTAKQEPLAENGSQIGGPLTSRLSFDGKTGSLECVGGGNIKVSGSFKVMGYEDQDLIISHARHYYVNGVGSGGIRAGEKVPILEWGTLTLTFEPATTGPITCETVAAGFVENPEGPTGAAPGRGGTLAFRSYDCSSASCPPGEVEIGGKKYEKEARVTWENLPWSSELTEPELGTVRSESKGVQVSQSCVARGSTEKPGPGDEDSDEPVVLF